MAEKISNSDLSTSEVDQRQKTDAKHVELETHSPAEYRDAPNFDQARTKKLLRKLDFHLVPFLALLYLCVFPAFVTSSTWT